VPFTAFFGFAAYVLGRLMEEKLRQAMILSRGSFTTFIENRIAAVLLAVAAAIVVIAVLLGSLWRYSP
jgi:putative tricarboxylic transport membrane protein